MSADMPEVHGSDEIYNGTCSECGCDLTDNEAGQCSVCYSREEQR